MKSFKHIGFFGTLLVLATQACAQPAQSGNGLLRNAPDATASIETGGSGTTELLDQHYGHHPRQTFDLWVPESRDPVPLVIYIHGGGWVSGSKDEMRERTTARGRYLKKGIAVASLEYRFLNHAALQTIMREDIGGFVQFIRANASKYKINPKKIMAYGASAGASASLWLATHDDLADPASSDPVKRESTRILAGGHLNGQLSYDFTVWYRFFGEALTDRFMGAQVYSRYHLKSKADIYTETGKAIRQDLDSYGNMSPDDAPLFLWASLEDDLARDYNHFVHSPRHAELLSDRAEEIGLKHETHIRSCGTGTPDPELSVYEFFLKQL
ncbi:MAG: hypothetical protein EBX52_01615 [Proteobacteria bacterium]|nr:hypothetical protein [Pseudomonadota bacterium]